MSQTENIFAYQDYQSYLRAILGKGRNGRAYFGVRHLAASAGFRSAGTISMIVAGKRKLTPSAADKISDALKLTGRKKRYFRAMAEQKGAPNEQERARARELVLRLRSMRPESLLEHQQYRFLAVWHYPVLYVLIGLKNISQEPASLARRLGRGLSASDVLRAFDDMLALDLIVRRDDRFEQRNGALSADDNSPHAAIRQYHQQMIAFGAESLSLPPEERETSGLTISVPEEQIPYVQSRVRKFRHEMNEYLSQFPSAERAFQINVQFFPLTRCESEK